MAIILLYTRRRYHFKIVDALDRICDGPTVVESVEGIQHLAITHPSPQTTLVNLAFGRLGHVEGEGLEMQTMGGSAMLMAGDGMVEDRGEGSSTGSHTRPR